MGIGSSLQRLIDARNTNVNEVATATGVKPSTLYSIIRRDSTSASIDDLYKIAKHLGVALEYFYSGYLEDEAEKKDTAAEEATASEEDDEERMFKLLENILETGGYIAPGGDITDEQLKGLKVVIDMLDYIFSKE